MKSHGILSAKKSMNCYSNELFGVYITKNLYICCRCTIDWKKGKNVTVKVIKKMQKHKGRGTKRTVTKTVQNDSFFNFFGPPAGELSLIASL